MLATNTDLSKYAIAVVIPCYRVEHEIVSVLNGLPDFIRYIIVVDDASPDASADLVMEFARQDARVILLRHEKNHGVGGAMVTGFQKALEVGAHIVVKLDGDGQMASDHLPELLAPLIRNEADYAKGNRFRDFLSLQKMPLMRRIGNMALGFLTKAATGYWNLFDPTNGYVAIRSGVLSQLNLGQIDHSYFFETSMLAQLYLLGAVVKDVPMPARYNGEISNLSIGKILLQFPLKLIKTLLRRLVLKYLIFDFSMASIYLLAGIPLLGFGLIFGAIKWIQYAARHQPAPTGTVMLPTLCVLLGIQFLIAAIEIDLRTTPKDPLSAPL